MARAKKSKPSEMPPLPEPSVKVPFNMRIPSSLKKRMGHWCIDNDREMSEVTEGLWELMLDGKIDPPAKKPRTKLSFRGHIA